MNRVVFVNRYFYPDHSATSQLLSELAFALASDGVSVSVITSRLRYDDPGAQLPAHEVVDGVSVTRVWSTRFGRQGLLGRLIDYLSFYPAAAIVLLRGVTNGDSVVAKTDPPLISVVGALVAGLKRARLINWCQDLFPEVAVELQVRGARMLAPLLRWIRNASLRRAQSNVVLGELMRERLLAFGIADSTIRVIPNWADGRAIYPIAAAENPLRREWALEGKFVVGYSGNLGRAHEFGTILDAAEQVQDRPEIQFLFIGSGAQEGAVQEAVRRRGLSNVVFKPYQPKSALARSLSAADVHLVSLQPRLEGLIVPSKFYGVAAAGRATLFIGDCDGEIARLLHRHTCGYAIPLGDANGLAERIVALASDAALTAKLGVNARAMFDAHFDREAAIKRWRDALGIATAGEQ